MNFQLPEDACAWCCIPTSLPQELAAKTEMLSVVSLEVFSIVYSWEGRG